jgi:hypothetical protein
MRQFKPGQLQTGSIYNISSSYALTASYALNGGTGVGGGNYIATGSVTASVSLGNGSFTITSGSSTFMFVSSSGNVGFGTTTPIYNLHNTGTTGLSQVFGLSPSLYVYNGRTAHDSTVRFENQSGDQLYFGGNGLFVTGNTTIGNGSTSLSARLGVKGSGTTSATTALLVQNSNSETTIIAKNDRTIGLGRSAFTGEGYGGIAIGHPDAGNLQYSSYDAHTFNVFNGASYETALLIKGNGASSRVLIGPSSNTTYKFQVSGSNSSGSVNLDNTLYVSGSNVGIGTSSPSTRLHVIGSEYTFAATSGGINFYNTPGVNSHFNFTNLRQDSDYIFRQNRNGVVNTTSLILKGNTGNVLINTTTDAGFRLDVNGTARFTGTVTTPAAVFSDSSGTSRITLVGAGGGLIGTNCYLGTNAILGYNLTSGAVGNVAIGGNFNAVASAILEIRSTTKGFLPPRMTTTERNAIASPAAGLIVYETGSAATEGLWLNETTGWQQLLTNSGSQSISGSLNVTSITTSDATISGNVTVSGTASINTLIVNQIGYSSGSNQLGDAVDDTQTLYGTVRIPTGSLTVTGSITQNESTASFGGVVGIGTTTPNASLDIRGTQIATGSIARTMLISSSLSASANNNTLVGLDINPTFITGSFTGVTNYGIRIASSTAAGNNGGQIAVQATDGAVGVIGVQGGGWGVLGLWGPSRYTVSATPDLRVRGNDGGIMIENFMLIGTTTNAGYKLDVNGTARSTDFRLTDNTLIAAAYTVGGTSLTISNTGHFNATGISVTSAVGIRAYSNIGVGVNNILGASIYAAGGSSFGYISLGLLSNRALITSTASGLSMHTSSMLQVDSTTQGFLPPRTNLTSNISTPAQGLMTYLTGSTNEGLYYYSSGSIKSWTRLLNDTGSQNISGSLSIIGFPGTGSALYAYKSGSTVVDVQGSQGQLFSVTDDLSNSLFSVNTIAGLPVIEAFATNDVNIGKYNTYPIKTTASGTLAVITGSISGSVAAPGSTTQIVFNNGGTLFATSSFVYSGSNVGIGTSTPSYALDVAGVIRSSISNGVNFYGNTTDSKIYLNTSQGAEISYQNWGFSAVGGWNQIGGNTIVGANLYRISSLTPSARLQVRGGGATSATTALLVENSAGTQTGKIDDQGNTTWGSNTSTGTHTFRGSNVAMITLSDTLNGYSTTLYKNAASGYLIENNSTNKLSYGYSGNYWMSWHGSLKAIAISSTASEPTPATTAILDLQSTTKGFLPPRTDLTSNISTPAQGLMTYITASATEGLYYYNSGSSYQGWTRLLNDSGSQVIVGSLNVTGSINATGSVSINGGLTFTGGANTAVIATSAANYGTARIGLIGGYDFLYGAFNSGGVIVGYNTSKGVNGVTTHGGQPFYLGQYWSGGNAFVSIYSGNAETMRLTNNQTVGIGTSSPLASLHVAGTTRLSGSFNTATSGSILTVIGSGSAQPIFTVQGSQGELFSITDSLSGSLFSVNDISGLPILEVFSDNTTLIGNYQDPMLITTTKLVTTASGAFTLYSLPTASYDTAFFEYSIKSGSNARAGSIMAIQSGTSVNFTETTTTDFGSTAGFGLTVQVTGSNMLLTGSATTAGWTIKTIVRSI